MAKHRWPTDPPGKAPAHTISWAQHQKNMKAKQQPSPTTSAPDPATAAPEPTAAPVPPTAPPPDPLYDSEVKGLEKARDIAIANAMATRTQGLANYGFTEDVGSGGVAFDPNNPFSRAALLKRSYNESRARTGQQMGAGGQMYAGAFQTQQDAINRGQLQGEDQLQKALMGFLSENAASRTAAQTGFELGMTEAEAKRTARIADNPLYDPIAIPEPPAPAGPVIGTPATASGGIGKAVSAKGPTLTAGKGIKGSKAKRKGKTVTYTAQMKGP